ncbi:MAG: peptidoglycan-associated lipoprotein Pal [Nitrospirae bacterium]|nr:peptidoglycan-associated lipoprotein Pal [Nitrospirota bacterium]
MAAPLQQPYRRALGLWLIILTAVFGCTGRKITTAVEDQAFLPGPSAAPVVEPAKVSPPPTQRVEPKIETPTPMKPPALEEVRVAEQPVTVPQSAPAPAAAATPSAEISDVFFEFDQFAIRSDARSLLEANAASLKAQAGHAILIEGHCDERGTSAYNLVLGERRAQATKQYLQDLGVPASQIQITSYGKERPFCAEHSESCWQANRRAHFRRP